MSAGRGRPLTDRQTTVLEEIARYSKATGEPCRVSYLARHLDMPRETIRVHVTALARKGWLLSGKSPLALKRRRV